MTYPIPTTAETKKLINIRVRKSKKPRGRAAIEGIKAQLEKKN